MNASTGGEVWATLRELVADIKPKAREFDDAAIENAVLTRDIGLDSLDLINLLFRCEEKFKCIIPAEDVDEKFLTFGKFVEYLKDKMSK